MITNELKNQVDKIWEAFWSGGISNPLTVIEQFTYLIFIKSLENAQKKIDKKKLFNKDIKDIFTKDTEHLKWSNFKNESAEEVFEIFQNQNANIEVGRVGMFPFIKSLSNQESSFSKYMKDASFLIPSAKLLQRVIDMIDKLNLDDKDMKGDLYEYLLSKLASAGTNGQFRTPRHIIKMMTVLMLKNAKIDENFKIYDPACGTAGFLVNSIEYISEYRDEVINELGAKKFENLFYGNDFDISMARIASMNMLLHNIDSAHISNLDALSKFDENEEDKYSLILANPPFKGSLDYSEVSTKILEVAKTKKTELLFVSLIIKALKVGGKCAIIVPDGVLFGSSKAHKDIRKEIVSNQQLDAIISMPSGVFKPYAGVSTAIIIFTKTNGFKSEKVWFYDMQNDGFSLNDNRTPIDSNDIPDILTKWDNLEEEKNQNRSQKSFFVPISEIEANEYDLSINRYKEIEYEEVIYPPTSEILAEIENLNNFISKELSELREML